VEPRRQVSNRCVTFWGIVIASTGVPCCAEPEEASSAETEPGVTHLAEPDTTPSTEAETLPDAASPMATSTQPVVTSDSKDPAVVVPSPSEAAPECLFEFAPAKVPEIAPCGGNPAGPWVMQDVQFPYLRLDTSARNNETLSSCPGQIVEGTGAAFDDFFWRFELETLQFEIEVDVPALDVIVHREDSCFREPGLGSCNVALKPPCRLSCGVCACDVAAPGHLATLRFDVQAGTASMALWERGESFNYCINGDVLELSSPDLGLYLQLKQPSGCRLGACRSKGGEGMCAGAYTQDHCEQRLDCEWFPDECNDEPCRLEEYGVNPACVL
jgi:hypothetical protein